MSPALFRLCANAVLIVHFLYVAGVVGGLLLILWGGFRRWAWVRNVWLRLIHLAAIGYVVFESWLGLVCPLTSLEVWLRQSAGQTVYRDDFIAYWTRQLMFFSAPPWVFTAAYTAFGALVLFSWWLFPPSSSRRPDYPA